MKRMYGIILLLPTLALAQANIANARLETRSAGSRLQSQVAEVAKSGATAWIAWMVPSIKRDGGACCYNMHDNAVTACGCTLESGNTAHITGPAATQSPVKLEGDTQVEVFARVEGGQIEKLRVFGPECPIDAQNMPVYWFNDVNPRDSVALLKSVAEKAATGDSNQPADGAVLAIAVTNDGSADGALDQLIAQSQPEWLRKKVAFWLGLERGKSGLGKLLALMKSDPSDSFRRELVFPISQSKQPEAEAELMRIARQDQSTGVREQAIFWLAQKAGKKVAGFVKDTVDNDPNTEVKKRAVFALSQMPKDEGIPLLIQVAKTNQNPEVRKQAMFWLGQSHDPRALDYIESVLKQ